MSDKIFREKSIKRISSPENLSEYLRVTTPAMWAILTGVAIVLLGIFVWSHFVVINSYAYGEGVVENGILTVTYENQHFAKNITEDMLVSIGDVYMEIDTVGRDEKGHVVTISDTNFPDGEYEAKACYKQTKVIRMLFN